MAIKLIVFDVDNTLAKPNMPIPQSVIKALKQFEIRGVKIFLISGKPVSYLSGLARQLGLQNPMLSGENGAIIYYSNKFPPKKSIIAIRKKAKILEKLESEIVNKFGKRVWIQPNLFNLTIFPMTERVKEELFQFVVTNASENSFKKKFRIYKHSDSIEVVHLYIDKGFALRKITRLNKIKKYEVIAVGDAENDIPMFKEAGISIGIGMSGTTYSFPNIQKAIQFVYKLIGG